MNLKNVFKEYRAATNRAGATPRCVRGQLPFRCCNCREVLVAGENWMDCKASRRNPVCDSCSRLYSKATYRRKAVTRETYNRLLKALGHQPGHEAITQAGREAVLAGQRAWDEVMAERRLRPRRN